MYEDICFDFVKSIFENDLQLVTYHACINDGIHITDCVAIIKYSVKQEFWKVIEHFFNTKIIVFECKNYKNAIPQNQIFTTAKYLYLKALRSVAIIFARKGLSVNAQKVVDGLFRSECKLILCIDDIAFKQMVLRKERYEEPSDYLLGMLNKYLLRVGR